MSPRLRDRQKSVPNGLVFFQPQIPAWKPSYQPSFSSLVQQVISMRKANPYITQKNNLSTDPGQVADEVDTFNARHCLSQGWDAYVQTDGGSVSIPKSKTPHQSQASIAAAAGVARKLWAGLRSTNDWIDSGVPAVPQEQAEIRAAVCEVCPLNGKGGFEAFFTVPASAAIKRQVEKLSARKLSTSHDAKLNVCTACLCPLTLLVQTPLQFKLAHMTLDTRAALDPKCWVTAEEKATKH
jgi:hypothetical protein